ncbi:MAG: carbon-nitrogen family hydrolase [Myxococcales bacterium]|nr:carbon-nitrogen family hydrolase [Myxococcales bacterium]
MRVAAVQLDIAWEDAPVNFRRAEARIQEAAAAGAALVVLPELFACGFTMLSARVAEAPGGPTETFLADVSRGLGVHILAGVPLLRDAGLPRNCAVLVSPDGEVRRAGKLHAFSFADEDKHYTTGDEVHTWTVGGVRITPLVCYDLRFVEPFRLVAEDTDAFVVIANWPERRRAHWQTLLRARAIETQAYVVGVNRCGDGDGLHYAGDSALISPWGEVLAGGAETEAVYVAEVDPAVVSAARASFPALRDRRPEYRRAE